MILLAILNHFKYINKPMNINTEELDAFLMEAELVNQKVKALAENRATTDELDQFYVKRQEDKRKTEEAKIRNEKQAFEQKVRGREGKGITKDFANFCRHCHLEYLLETITCLKCNKPTMSLTQRQHQLFIMVDDYKSNKAQREQKRQKWDMFQKTQAALWKKSSISYNKKWDHFVEDSDEEQKEPILPTNDPNFKALEMDMLDRKQKRSKDQANAKRIKDKGNAAMRDGDYVKAIEFYTLSLEHAKDIKSVYTNRALAYIKRKRYQKAIKDCSNVIEYMEVFEKVGENKDLMFKAFSRRALARKEAKEFRQALEDVEAAIKLFPNDGQALLLKKEIQSFLQHSQTVQKLIRENREAEVAPVEKKEENEEKESSEDEEQKSKILEKEIVREMAEEEMAEQNKKQQEQKKKAQAVLKTEPKQPQTEQNPIKQIPKRLEQLNEQNTAYLIQLLIRKTELRSIFVASKGIEKTLDHLVKVESPMNEALLIYMCLAGDGVGEKRVWDWGVHKIYDIILAKFEDESKLSFSVYGYIDNLLQILVPMSLSDVYRPQLSSDKKTCQFVEAMFPRLITKYKKQTMLLDNFMTFFSNLCSGESSLKNSYLKTEKIKIILDSLYHYVLSHKSKNRELLDLKQSLYSFIANVITNLGHRKMFVELLEKDDRMGDIKQELESYPKDSHNFEPFVENVLSVTANAFLDSQFEAVGLAEVIFERFIKNWEGYSQTIVFRALLTVGRIKYTDNKLLPKWMKTFDKMALKVDALSDKGDKMMQQVIKILNILFLLPAPEVITELPVNIKSLLIKLIQKNDVNEQLFCNTCNLMGILIDKKNGLSEKMLLILRDMIGHLVEIAKQRVGNWRKSAAILLGKTSSDPKCREELDRHHGMDVLKSIATFVLDKK